MCILLASGLATKSLVEKNKSYSSDDFGPPQKLTSVEESKLLQSTAAIYNHFGEFKRVSTAQSFDISEISYSEESITPKTKELILYYGTFVKVSDK